ncbi:MAG: hypothetical protein ABIR38_09940 [Chthoniobacterales bacterium]
MKSIPLNGRTIGIGAAILVVLVGITWAIARSTSRAEIAAVRAEIASREHRAAASLAESALLREAAWATAQREAARGQDLEKRNQQLQQANEDKEKELAAAETNRARSGRGGGGRRRWQKASATPQRTLQLGSGEEQAIIPGVLDLRVEKLDSGSAEIQYGGHPHHLNIGENVTVSYLGRPCVLGLTEIKAGGETPKGTFSFAVMPPGQWASEAAVPAEGPPNQ